MKKVSELSLVLLIVVLVFPGFSDAKEVSADNHGGQESKKGITLQKKVPLIISNVQATSTTGTSTLIQWDTNKLSDSQVVYWKTASSGTKLHKLYTATATDALSHSIFLNNLELNTSYTYIVKSTDLLGQTKRSPKLSFTTLPLPPLAFVGVSAQNITATSALIVWDTNTLADSKVTYWKTASSSTSTSVVYDPNKVIGRSLFLGNLTPSTTYAYVVTSSDTFGRTVTSSVQIFTTTQLPFSTPSIITDDFNSYSEGSVVDQGGWLNRENGTPWVEQGSIVKEGTKALYNNYSGVNSIITKTSGTALADGKQSFWVRPQNRANWGDYDIGENVQLGIFQGSWDGPSRATLAFMKDGHVAYIGLPNIDAYVNFDTYIDNDWNLVEMEWRAIDKTARYRLNGGTWTDRIPFTSHAPFTGFDTVGFVTFSLGTGGVYVDSLQ